MGHKLGRNGDEYWIRCTVCGDSDNISEGHLSVNTTGLFNCFRCGSSGKVTSRVRWELFGEDITGPSEPTIIHPLPTLSPGSATGRRSSLERFHANGKYLWDAFESRDPKGELRGIHLRRPGDSRTFGERFFGYSGASLRSNRLRLVEGPYDCLVDEDVCLFGGPSRRTLKYLRGYELLLCPDGDVIHNPDKLRQYLRAFTLPGLLLVGMELLPDGMDPDEVPINERRRIGSGELNKLMNEVRETNAKKSADHFRRACRGWEEHGSSRPPRAVP